MADRSSTSSVAADENSTERAQKAELDPLYDPLREAIEEERSRLALADSVLGCLWMALEHAEECDDTQCLPSFADVAGLAREIVRESINKLDSVHMRPLLAGKKDSARSHRRQPSKET
jgi:hypothetical protein